MREQTSSVWRYLLLRFVGMVLGILFYGLLGFGIAWAGSSESPVGLVIGLSIFFLVVFAGLAWTARKTTVHRIK